MIHQETEFFRRESFFLFRSIDGADPFRIAYRVFPDEVIGLCFIKYLIHHTSYFLNGAQCIAFFLESVQNLFHVHRTDGPEIPGAETIFDQAQRITVAFCTRLTDSFDVGLKPEIRKIGEGGL